MVERIKKLKLLKDFVISSNNVHHQHVKEIVNIIKCQLSKFDESSHKKVWISLLISNESHTKNAMVSSQQKAFKIRKFKLRNWDENETINRERHHVQIKHKKMEFVL